MSQFRYKALTSGGETRAGIQEAESQAAVFRKLRQQGLWPVDATELSPSVFSFRRGRARLTHKEMAAFFHELATLIGSGIALDRALALLSERKASQSTAQATGRLLARVRDGASLAQALAADEVFPRLAVGFVRAAETTGTLETELLRLSSIMAKTAAIRSEIVSALVYPVILLITAALAIGVVMTVVVPEFAPLFDDAGHPPPAAFRFLIACSAAITSWGWLAAIICLAGFIAMRLLSSKPAFRHSLDRAKLKLPVVSNLLRDIETERFCRTLGTLVKSDVALPAAVALAAEAVANESMAAALNGVAAGLREGRRLVERLAVTGQFSAEVLDLLRIGEETGRLGDMLIRQADVSEQRTRTKIARLLAIMVPGITLILGLVVAGIVASLLIAILSINDLALQ